MKEKSTKGREVENTENVQMNQNPMAPSAPETVPMGAESIPAEVVAKVDPENQFQDSDTDDLSLDKFDNILDLDEAEYPCLLYTSDAADE